MNSDPIGVFDSGIGGLTCVKELNKLMPNENIVYFGDTARIPYGTRSKETILKYTRQSIAFLKQHNVKMIIAACGTVSSVIGNNQNIVTDMPFTGVLIPAVQAACGVTRNKKVGVIGTPLTIKCGGYGKAIRNIRPDIHVIGNSCALLVPLAENGFAQRDNQVSKLVLEQYLEPIKKENIDTLILGCTHYPLFLDAIQDYMGENVTLISAGAEAAKYACAVLTQKELLTEREGKGINTFYSSDSIALFEEHVKTFLGQQPDGEVLNIDIDYLTSLN